MIASLTGVLTYKTPQYVIVDVQGVGYRITTPLSSFYSLPDLNDRVVLLTHTYVREDAIQLFGFLTLQERDAFLLLLTINGIGPRLALNILSGLSVHELKLAIEKGDLARLGSIPGVGKKTAARLVLELKEKILSLGPTTHVASLKEAPSDSQERLKVDALAGLVYLGYQKAQAREGIDRLMEEIDCQLTVEQLIRDSLKLLSKG